MTDKGYVGRATELDPQDAPPDKRYKYRRLKQHHDQRGSGAWTDASEERELIGLNVVEAIASQLELTDLQKKRAESYFRNLDSDFRSGRPLELVAIVICAVSGWQDGRNYHPNAVGPNSNIETRLSTVIRDSGYEYESFYRMWSAVKENLGV